MATLIDEMREAGFSDDSINSWAGERRPQMKEAGFDDDTIDSYLSGLGKPKEIPKPFIERMTSTLGRIGGAVAEGAKAGFGEQPIGLTPKDEETLSRAGVFRSDQQTGPGQSFFRGIRFANEAMIRPSVAGAESMFRGLNAAFMGIGAGAGQVIAEASGANESEAAKARRDWANFTAMGALLLGTDTPVTRAPRAGGLPDEVIGRVPLPSDFTDAAKVVAAAPEAITGAAVEFRGQTYAAPNHLTAMQRAANAHNIGLDEVISGVERHDGFLTTRGRLVDREEAAKIASAADQVISREEHALQTDHPIENIRAAAAAGEGPLEASLLRPAPPSSLTVAREKIVKLYEDHGIHPAEVAADAKTDPAVKASILSEDKNDLPAKYIEAYHGSPHDFERFDVSKIGTGEGAQSYGHGLYFAENPAVARSYQSSFDATVNGRPYDMNFAPHKAAALVDEFGSREAAIAEAKALAARDIGDFYPDVLRLLESDREVPKIETKASLYRVRINADREHFLDWDKPLGELSEYVKAALKKAGWDADSYTLPDGRLAPRIGGPKGVDVIKSAMDAHPAEVSAKLSDAGIPGIKYLDQGSRDGKASGTSNIVLFDDKHVEITHKNGEQLTAKERADYIAEHEPTEAEGKPHPLGAAAAGEDIPEGMSRIPAAPGKIVDALRGYADKIASLGDNLQMLATPMATGTDAARVVAKTFANDLRRNRYEWSRIDDDIQTRFDLEQQKRMWLAADEESVARQLGESTEHQGLVTLTKEERAATEELQSHAQMTWAQMRDLGMVEGEGLPSYAPRMMMNVAEATGDGPRSLNAIGTNLKTSTPQMRRRKHMTAEETEAAAKAKLGEDAEIVRNIRTLPLATAKLQDAIAGRTLINNIKEVGKSAGNEMVSEGFPTGSSEKWFTIDHPAFRTWRPKLERDGIGALVLDDGKVQVVKDAEGNIIFESVPLYVRGDFEGPLKAVLNQKSSGAVEDALMSLKGKAMSLIMYSPMIHNAVEYGRAFPTMPGKMLTLRVYRDGGAAIADAATMREAIDHGLVPIGKRFFNQDAGALMEAPDLNPGRSVTAQILGETIGRLPQKGMTTAETVADVKRSIDKAGDFWHNTLLWDQVAKLQMGIYTNLRDALVEQKGVDPSTAAWVASHMANRYAGALPQEAMSRGARLLGNLTMFSRTFTLGNLGVLKDVFTGLPKDVLAMIERDVGKVDPAAVDYAKSIARRKALTAVVMDIGLMYVVNSVLQNAFNILNGDSTIPDEMRGYVRRFWGAMQRVAEHPATVLQPLSLIESLSATAENEPGKQDRVKVGYTKDGTAIYMRSPLGKIGEEFIGWMNTPIEMLKKKESTIARPIFQVLSNDAGFGRKVYDPNPDSPAKYFKNAARIVSHFVMAQTPEAPIRAGIDLAKGEGDPALNKLQLLGPLAGVTFSRGAPGGPAVGELYKAQEQHRFAVQEALPDLRRQIQRGDTIGAVQKMTELGISRGLQQFYIRNSLNPATRLSGKAIKDFYLYATPEQRDRLEGSLRARAQ